jgi:hypothetical protein
MPQLALSAFVSTHVFEQSVSGIMQTHMLAMHVDIIGHAVPHMPQLTSSIVVSVHMPPQSLVGGWQSTTHMLFTHFIPPPHLLLHEPQLSLSFEVSRHCMPQSFVPSGQPPVGMHCPFAHDHPIWQVRPQSPQLFESVRASTHFMLQTCQPVMHPAPVSPDGIPASICPDTSSFDETAHATHSDANNAITFRASMRTSPRRGVYACHERARKNSIRRSFF